MPGTLTTRLPDCRPLLADPADLDVVFQPVVDLTRARVAGYEALSRFPGTAGPEVWFAAAADAGVAAELQALALHRALSAVARLPRGTFLVINVAPHLLDSRPVQAVLAGRPDLRGVVLGLTGHDPVADPAAVRVQVAALRARGALVALDDTGAGWSGLHQVAALRPDLVALDRALLAGVDADPVRQAIAEVLSGLTGRTGSWLLAQGVETRGELAAVCRLGVPLAQGWLLGRPAPGFAPLHPEVAALVRAQAARARTADSVAGLLRPVRQVAATEPTPGVPPVVLVDPSGAPLALRLADPRTGAVHTAPVSLRAHRGDAVAETLHRALTRPPAHRFDPVVCTDTAGAVLGLVRVEDLASAAAAR
ncbi:EAL domain, c-di-GMP-specific phosphodiesterase class I (or its enzymatically inactive variant) [Geodermatophilus telluris]|uniref:EAL domain, c-di-GMP-specific phosphodiesterase class I (Or its enzymatically inactive variant) n=1 Tax=Geodermatophilus telluris TaxID=1190417 RepID=A0A1G6L134_9ACTN|nr:EAL domain-containing protein [Geodermatophilus telluris]SDC37050.1 EAL domain, c-di-GMP-specific phosphodiesterase class I (or its enzymatically inactive variant) [Geodermatophilus telluris]